MTSPLKPGDIAGSLRIDRVLGKGAFGITYLATDANTGKSFALKEFAPESLVERRDDGAVFPSNPERFAEGLAAFVDDGRTLARLNHPNIVSVTACFEANGTGYLQMPWYDGEALHKLLQRGDALNRTEVLDLAAPLIDALIYLHGRGVVHRDIKPANIFVTREGKPLLIDFGAKGTSGSEGYAAPEQYVAGGAVDARSDLYGLAATLYRCISGQIPPSARERQEAFSSGKPDPLAPLSRVASADCADLADPIEAALALEPGRRPRDAATWKQAWLNAGGRVAPLEPDEREWLPAILLGVFLVLLASALVYLLWPGSPGDNGVTTQSSETPTESPLSPREEAQWRAALAADTAYGYQRFLEAFPDSIHDDQARLHLERLDHQAWGRTRMEGTRSAVESYLEQFPNGLHLADADILLNEIERTESAEQRRQEETARQDEAAWETTRRYATIDAVDRYLSDWPGGLHAEEARALRSQLQAGEDDLRAFEAAQKLNSIEAYQSYIDAFPRGSKLADALEAIDDLTLRPGKVFRDCADCPEMMVLPAGSFWQGSEEDTLLALKSEQPRRMVTFDEPFAIGLYEVSFEQWDLCVAEGGCETAAGDNGWGRGDRPVMNVSWNDAVAFTEWLSGKTGQNYSLPSESEWEYAARAGEESDWIGGSAETVCLHANVGGGESGFRWAHEACADTAATETLPGGSLRPNGFGLYDTVGNVAEWTLDCMNLSYLDAPADGSAWSRGICSSRVTRGGSWFTGTREIRLPARFNLKNGDRNDFTGFRVVRVIDP